MADIKISQLPSATTPLAGTEEVPLVQSGTTKKATVNQILAGATGGVTAVTGTAPVVSSGGTTPAISMAAANGSTNGYLTSSDWTTFNSKQPAGSYLTSGGALGTPSSGTATNLTGLPLTTGVTGVLPIANGGTNATTATTARGNILPSYSGNAGKVLAVNSGATDVEYISASGSGTVTSVAVSGGTTGLTTSGGPITAAGTITLAGTLAVANGGTGTSTPALVAGTNVTITGTWPNQTINSSGGGSMTYPGAGIANSTGSAWGTSYTTSGSGTVVALATSPSFTTPILGTPQSGNFSTGTFTWPTFNQNTTGTAANITATSNSSLTTLSSLSLPGSQVSGNISGNAANVTGTVAIANGGTGQTTAAAAITALTGTQTSAYYLRSNGTNASLSALSAADLTGTVAIATGGSGQTTAQGAMNAFAGATTSGSYLRGNGTNVVMSTIQAADVPTLNQNTTGTAANVTGTVAIANGGTGATTAPAANAALQTYTTTATAAGTTTLTSASTYYQYFTGSTTQTVQMPVTSTLSLGWSYHIANNSTGNLTLTSSGGNTIGTVLPGTTVHITCILTSGTTAASWDYGTTDFGTVTGAGAVVLGTTPSVTNPTVTNYVETPYSANSSTAITLDLANGTVQIITLTGNATITMPTAVSGKSFIMYLKQDATGSRSVTWSTVAWPAGTAPTITSTASKQDIYSFFSDGSKWYGVTVGQNYTP